MANTEHRFALQPRVSHRGRVALWATCALLAVLTLASPGTVRADVSHYSFAVVANAVSKPSDEAAAQKLIDAIGRDPRVSFVVYDGNLKGLHEACADALYDRRHTMLDASRPALIFVPGEYDWVSCASNEAGNYDPVERLDLLRQTILADPSSLGQNPLALARESEAARFTPYRENVRWQVGDTVFAALNVPDGNNHYLYAGGRNGEFEDRVIANGFWLEHTAEYAKRRDARAIVIFIQGDPFPERRERTERFGWLRFEHRTRDGYAEFRRSLVKLAQIFRGPVILIHTSENKPARGFVIDQPLRNDRGEKIASVTRIAFGLRNPHEQWLRIDVDTARRPPLRVAVREVPQYLPPLPPPQQPPMLPTNGEPSETPDMPEISSMPDVTAVPQEPGEPASGSTSSATPSAPGSSGSGTPPGTWVIRPPADGIASAPSRAGQSGTGNSGTDQLPPSSPAAPASGSAVPQPGSVQRGL